MLVLRRKRNETITIPGLGITIVQLAHGKIGIIAPPEQRVHRGDVHQQREEERKAA